MTTIAYRDGLMAGDSLCVVNGWKQPHVAVKLHRMSDGTVCGVTGDLAVSLKFVGWLEGDRSAPAPDLGEAARVIHLHRDRRLTIYEGTGSFDVECEFTAFGSGAPAAQAAMYMGADARRAVEVAALLDESTGGEIVTMACGN